MRILPRALAIVTVVLLAACSHQKTGEGADKTPQATETASQQPSTPPPPESLDAVRDAVSTDDAGSQPRDGGPRTAQEACVDRWLAEQSLDRYGHPQGTLYTGGTPLFDERTGEQKDRLEYIFQRHPSAQQACPSPVAP